MNFEVLAMLSAFRLMIFIWAQVLIAISNTLLLKKLEYFKASSSNLKVSVLIPARNEERTIKDCVNSILNQDYENFEVLVLNDNSTDNTSQVLKNIESDKLKILEGQNLPAGWQGKNWACAQLASIASGDLLLFTDADTIYKPETLTHAVGAFEKTGADLISGINKNIVRSFGEKITVPFIVYGIFTILPLALSYLLRRNKAFAAANGKFLLFRREFYQKIGTHQAIKNEIVEDVALARLTKAQGGRWRLFDLSNLVTSRMYYNFKEAQAGFSKNYFALFDCRILPALFAWTWLGLVTYMPIIRTISDIIQNNFHSSFYYSAISIIATCFLWLLLSYKFDFPIYQFLLYPITLTVSIYIAFRSMILTINNRIIWKDRFLKRPKIRMI
jgi:chlorobactene glucosyltransferase